MATLRHKQMMPTPELLEEIYVCLSAADAERKHIGAPMCDALRHMIDAVSLLADLVDRELSTD